MYVYFALESECVEYKFCVCVGENLIGDQFLVHASFL